MLKEKEHISAQKNFSLHPDPRVATIEKQSGLSFSDVSIHYASELPKKFGALAFTYGNDVYLGSGHERYLKHELGHVMQQKQGMVKPMGYEKGMPINKEYALESHAEQALERGTNSQSPLHPVVQCFSIEWDPFNRIKNISIERPSDSVMNPRKLFPEWFEGTEEGLSTSHTTAFVVIQRTLENKLLGLNFIDALKTISALSNNITTYIGYQHSDSARKHLIDEKILEITNGIEEITQLHPTILSMPIKNSTNWNALIHHYAHLYFLCRNSLYYTYHLFENGGGAKGEAAQISLLSSQQNTTAALEVAVKLFDKNFVNKAYELATFQQHIQTIAQYYQSADPRTGIFHEMVQLSKDYARLQRIIDSEYKEFK